MAASARAPAIGGSGGGSGIPGVKWSSKSAAVLSSAWSIVALKVSAVKLPVVRLVVVKLTPSNTYG